MTSINIEIEPLWELGGGPIISFHARGHHDQAAFLRALLEYVVEEGYEEKLPFAKRGSGFYPKLRVLDVHLLWWRWVPCLDDAGYPGGMAQHNAEPHSRGAFKVTCWECPL